MLSNPHVLIALHEYSHRLLLNQQQFTRVDGKNVLTFTKLLTYLNCNELKSIGYCATLCILNVYLSTTEYFNMWTKI
jgi:hypothetical protein